MTLSFRNLPLVFLSGFAVIILVSLFVVSTQDFLKEPQIFALGVTADITTVIPLLFYFFVIRKYKLSPVLIVPVFILCVILASIIIPVSHQYYLDFIKQGLILCELLLVSYGAIKISRVVKAYKNISLTEPDFIERFHKALNKVFGKSIAVSIAASEIAMIYYSLSVWKTKPEASGKSSYFTYHRKSSYIQLWAVILFVLILETFAIHALVSDWNVVLSRIFLGLSIYTLLFLVADIRAAIKRPIIITTSKLYLRTGIRWRAIVSLHNIESIQNYKDKLNDRTIINAALSPETNLLITFKNPVTFQGIYGISKRTKMVSLFVDDIDKFKQLLE
jgi:hypothetical protein